MWSMGKYIYDFTFNRTENKQSKTSSEDRVKEKSSKSTTTNTAKAHSVPIGKLCMQILVALTHYAMRPSKRDICRPRWLSWMRVRLEIISFLSAQDWISSAFLLIQDSCMSLSLVCTVLYMFE